MQKRNCRMTVNEAKAHDQAVKLRKMTDVQLLKFMEDGRKKAWEEGFETGKTIPKLDIPEPEPISGSTQKTAKEFVHFLLATKLPGIGTVTTNKVIAAARENGFIESA